MSVNFNNSDSGVARALYQAHGYLSEPAYRAIEFITRCRNPLTPGIFDHYSTKPRELAYRMFAPGLLIAGTAYLVKQMTIRQFCVLSGCGLLLEVVRLSLHLTAVSYQKKNYIHVKGNAKVVKTDTPTIASWNVFGFPAGGNYTWGGCTPFRNRFSEIVETIRKADPDILVLQECIMDAKIPEDFIREFKDTYAHFFIHNGPQNFTLESGLLVMSKCPVLSYDFTPFTEKGGGINRGFATLKIMGREKTYAIIGTHMEAGDAEKRKSQLAQIHAAAKKINTDLVIFAGDSNVDMNSPESQVIHQALLYPNLEITCTNVFRKLRNPKETGVDDEAIDQIAIINRGGELKDKLHKRNVILGYENRSSTARSDHHMLVATILNGCN